MLNLPHQIQPWPERFLPWFPIRGTHFAAMFADVLRGLQFAQQFAGIAANAVVIHFKSFKKAVGVNQKSAPERQALGGDVHTQLATEFGGRVGEHGESDFFDGRGIVVPSLVRENSVRADAQYFSI